MSTLQIAFNYILVIFTVLPVIITLVKHFARLTKNNSLLILADYADYVVRAIEQSGIVGSSNKRKTAINELEAFSKKLGLNITNEQLATFIESAVYLLNKDQNGIKKPSEETVKQLSIFDGEANE